MAMSPMTIQAPDDWMMRSLRWIAAPPHGEDQSEEHQRFENVLGKEIGVPDAGVEQRQLPTREETLDHHGHGSDADNQESVEDQQMVDPGEGIVEHLLLAEGIDQNVFESFTEPVETVLRPTQLEHAETTAQ